MYKIYFTTFFFAIAIFSFCLLFRLEDATLAITKLQQSLKIKEEKITELESQYVFVSLYIGNR